MMKSKSSVLSDFASLTFLSRLLYRTSLTFCKGSATGKFCVPGSAGGSIGFMKKLPGVYNDKHGLAMLCLKTKDVPKTHDPTMFKSLQHHFPVFRQAALLWLRKYGWRLSFLGVFTLFLLGRDFEIQLNFNTVTDDFSTRFVQNPAAPNPAEKPVAITASQQLPKSPALAQQRDYINRFARTAQEEMKKYGIPASITLAQGLLESGAGESPLATRNNNHFGIKCFSKKCKKGHCRNFSDDHHKDFFRVYASAWESYRAHSLFLQQDRYKDLFHLPQDDYRGWAYGLKKAGYATDKKYPEKLIRLIESLGLDAFDS